MTLSVATPVPANQSPAIPNPLGDVLEKLSSPGFVRFGEWSEQVSVARDGAIHRLARWMALQPKASRHLGRTGDAADLWDACRTANASCFREYRIVRLDRPSYFLPAGEVVFSVLENPVQVPDNPPTGVMMRHLEAMDAFPTAKFFFLRPVFSVESTFELLPPAELRNEAWGDKRVALQIARQFGWAHRAERWTNRQLRRAGQIALEFAGRAVDALVDRLTNPTTGNSLTTSYAANSLAGLAAAAERDGRLEEAARFRTSLAELRRRQNIDPVLCFELPQRPGELWFESHWFEGTDGRTYVHY